MEIDKYSMVELEAEIKKRKAKGKELEKQRLVKICELYMKHLDVFLELTVHERTSCSDERPNNVSRCSRCDFLKAKRDNFWPENLGIVVYINRK